MKLMDVYAELNKCVKLNVEGCNHNYEVIDNLGYMELMKKLEGAAKLEACKRSGTKAAKLNAIKSIINNKNNNHRPVLQTYLLKDGKMMFTDSYVAFSINSLEDNPFKKFDDSMGTYPDLERFLNHNVSNDPEITIDINDLKLYAKTHKKNHKEEPYKVEGLTDDSIAGFDSKYLLNAFDILGDNIKWYYNNRALIGINDNDEKCIICGIRNY